MILIMFLCWALTTVARGTANLAARVRPRRLELVADDGTTADLATETTAA